MSQDDWRRRVVSSVGEDMREERWTDLVLYSTEGAPVPVHRAVLSQSPHLRPLLRSLSCCQAGCSTLIGRGLSSLCSDWLDLGVTDASSIMQCTENRRPYDI